jgi:two-component system, NarL family, sensor histidine kinase UhpB
MPSSELLEAPIIYLLIITDKNLHISHCNQYLYEMCTTIKGCLNRKPISQLKELLPVGKCKKAIRECTENDGLIFKITHQTNSPATKYKTDINWEMNCLNNQENMTIGYLFTGEVVLNHNENKALEISEQTILSINTTIPARNYHSTEFDNAQQALYKSEQQFRALSENIPGAVYEYIFRKDGSFGFKYLSPAIFRMFGISVEIFSSSLKHIHPDDIERLKSANKHSLATNEPFYFEGRIVMPDGKIKWYSASSSFSYSTPDDSKVFTGIILDITNRKMEEENLSKSEAQLKLTLEKIGDNAWEHNYITNETQFSETIYNLLGYSSLSLKNNIDLWWNSIHPVDKWIVEDNDKKYRAGLLYSHSVEYRVYHANGNIKWILDRGVVIEKNADGTPVSIVGTHTDITTEKEMHEKYLVHEQQKKKEILQAVLDAQEREREEIAYELNENVNQVLAMSKMMLDLALHTNRNVASVLETVIENLNELIEEVKTIGHSLSSSTIKLIGLPQAIETLFIKINLSGKISFKLDYSSYKPVSKPEPKITLTIFRIAQEQIINIIKHSGATHANITLGNSEKEITIEISDDGHGFDTLKIKKGLGLVNMFNRVESYNGMIELKSEPGRGCVLKVSIPFKGSGK